MEYEGKEILRVCEPTDIKLQLQGWKLILTEAGWRAVARPGTVTFWWDDPLDALLEAVTVQKRHVRSK